MNTAPLVLLTRLNEFRLEVLIEKITQLSLAATEKSINRPSLPFAIIALVSDDDLFDPDFHLAEIRTLTLVGKPFGTIRAILDSASFWQRRGEGLSSIEQLLLCWFAGVLFVQVTTKVEPLLLQQITQLYQTISQGCTLAELQKRHLQVALNSESLITHFQAGFDHFSQFQKKPIDFVLGIHQQDVKSSRWFGSILGLAKSIIDQCHSRGASWIFTKLSEIVASYVLLDVQRRKGTSFQVTLL